MRIEITIPGQPVPKGRPRVTYHGTYTPQATVEYEKKVRQCWQEQSGERIPDGLPIRLTLVAFFAIPKSYSKKKKAWLNGKPHTVRPDLDNLVKSCTDALQDQRGFPGMGAFADDSQICSIKSFKFFSNTPRVWIILEEGETDGYDTGRAEGSI